MIKRNGLKSPEQAGLSNFTLGVFAVAAGLSVANIYYAHPLLRSISQDLLIPSASIGLVMMLTQAGYGLGLMLIVPLGDIIDRRKLILGQGALAALALLSVSFASSAAYLLMSLAVTGIMAVAVQVLVSFVATLAAPELRGKAVGIVTSGVVIGILGARVVSGLVADALGWRAVYLASCIASVVMVFILACIMPKDEKRLQRARYSQILSSIPTLFISDRVLRLRCCLAFLIFAAFSTFWTALVLPLSSAPFTYSHFEIGIFGLVGLAGALAASSAGTLADRGFSDRTTTLSLAILLISWCFIALLPTSVISLVIGVLLLDLAVQAAHVTNQSVIFARHPDAHSRVVALYMLFYA